MTESLPELLERVRRAPVPARSLSAVHGRADRIRRGRRRAAIAATTCTVAGIVALTQFVLPGATSAPAPAATDRSSAPATTPAPGRSPDGLLYPADLGAHWWPAGSQTTNGDLQIGCTGFVMASGLGTLRFFEGTSPVGGEWSVQESVVPLDAAMAREVAGKLAEPARTGCATLRGRDVVLAASEQVLVVSGLTPAGSVGEATVYALVGRTWLTLRTSLHVTGSTDTTPLPLPGQTDWLLQVAGTAIERATGTRPPLPQPHAAARSAAAKYVTPSPMAAPSGPDGGVATGDPGATPTTERTPPSVPRPTGAAATAPEGFLTLADLGPGGAWSVGTRPDDHASGRELRVQLPAGAAVPARVVPGRAGGLQTYRGWLGSPATEASGNTWVLTEEILRLDPARRADDAGAFARLLADSGPFTSTTLGRMDFYWSDGSGFVVARPGAGAGSLGVMSGWVLRGDVLVQLTSYPGGPGGDRAVTPSDAAWFIRLLDLAARRAAG